MMSQSNDYASDLSPTCLVSEADLVKRLLHERSENNEKTLVKDYDLGELILVVLFSLKAFKDFKKESVSLFSNCKKK